MMISRICLFACCYFVILPVHASFDEFDMSIEEILDLTVTTASGVEESLLEAPAAMLVLTEKDFIERGYFNLSDILQDLPGFDVIESNSSGHVVFYQRGYRSPWPTRTLLLIDGVVDNHLWTQSAMLSRQYPVSNIKRIEVLYGPASVVYGPNAFAGIINVISKDANNLIDDQHVWQVRSEIGSWNSRGLELSARGRFSELAYSFSSRVFKSDEEDLSGRWGFLSNELYNDESIWGPMRDLKINGRKLDHYADPTDDSGVLAQLFYRNLKFGLIYWHLNEGLGGAYAADRGHVNTQWQYNSRQYYLEHRWQVEKIAGLEVKSFALARSNRIWGDWTEASPDLAQGMARYSYISHTQWNSDSEAYEFKQDFNFTTDQSLYFNGGWRFKRSDLTKAYDVPGYWQGGFSSTTPSSDLGPYGFGAAIYHSSDPVYDFESYPLRHMPAENRQKFTDHGFYLSTRYQWQDWQFTLGDRYDVNSLWGSSHSPRLAAIYNFNQGKSSIKAIYGEAFQEGAAILLYGGWNGRIANPDLKPERAKNMEVILLHQAQDWLHDISIFNAQYKNVIREDAVNDGARDIWGFEYRGRFERAHPNVSVDNIKGYFYYSYILPRVNRRYDHQLAQWVSGNELLGDISRHKVNAGIHWPLDYRLELNLKANFIYRTELYSRNALRPEGYQVGSRLLFDVALQYHLDDWRLSFKVENLFNRQVLAAGLRKADAGDDFSQRSLGYLNSVIPLPSRSLWLSINYKF